ncbi:sterol desaturase/sphingolipid hydroxylase (fatty acid hydroxylase superfamily) [Cupriavidus gilardii J11]|uniref:Sterol desaturase/sphingolipid hydroxylase (Fatty acid hydroxylase superfamily) n=1 Tax=Cupriavidus gilardii J11 TaxID=936133 RepID=A0A562BMU0_9BURK|nr:sterol desaturase family protein [Cupriavidus gilardii]TWG86615.1 sterol desaturase/sphingolipid hydroxylase (fatty acid hydroxylase superfamily) [Cupriavidus gilardii J11]
MLSVIDGWLADLEGMLFQHVVLPVVYAVGLGGYAEEAFTGTEWLVIGLLQLAVMLLVMVPLERWRPVEPLTQRAAVRTDMLYTAIHRLGLFRLAMFFTLDPFVTAIEGQLHLLGWQRVNVEDWWPAVTANPLVSFLIYLVLFDLLGYWYHRLSHTWRWWWCLHAVHHSQTQMTLWSDNRNHLLDDMLRGLVFAVAALAIGVEPSQFLMLVALSQLHQSLQHANVRLHFGTIGERLLVSPRFHRTHHAIGIGHEAQGQPARLGGCNYGVLFPWWDMLFGTARFTSDYAATGIRDQLPPPAGKGRDYGAHLLAQQWYGIKRLFRRA